MKTEEISNNNESIKIYKRVGSIFKKPISSIKTEKKYYIPKHILKNKKKIETKLSIAMLMPEYNSLTINKYNQILNNIDLMIKNRLLEGEL
ncbi:MAG: hypothetical protein PF569_04495 [Candidatus Woesearchaeota archaeon]|jgi:hypothetical protein|nr:hypothetical protein [Candidatus Woesearchaeota archaeon]